MTFAERNVMHLPSWIAAVLVLSLASPAAAQEWENFLFPEDGFEANFPGPPEVEETTWISQLDYELPARIYRASRGDARYSVTAVDYRPLEQLGQARLAACPPGAETCIGRQGGGEAGSVIGVGYWKIDLRGAPTYAVLKFLRRGGTVTDYNLEFQDLVEGYFLRLTNPDESRTLAYITMHENRLYIYEGTTPKGAPDAALFTGAAGFVDADGNNLRYTDFYSNTVHGLRQHEPPPVRVNGVVQGAPDQ